MIGAMLDQRVCLPCVAAVGHGHKLGPLPLHSQYLCSPIRGEVTALCAAAPGDEHKMGPRPDYGYNSYKGSGKLKEKVSSQP